ncbi:hypothetical protein [Photobacterium lipolyticum]|uniref:Uncharacterized protein n=1 Tax=Photobacterium lipolyticum TaxID=266810 RepID=A0A2T3MZ17_9GAMM|nr:hypothetical protein [Photobacterium lipolyticum]PSW05173.1 hypothetical protein C9I89_10325 [Photobacterium lipolyticum]
MNKLSKLFIASTLGGAALMANATISLQSLDNLDFGLVTMSEAEMSSVRGGFQSIGDTIINIGLSISTALNGEKIFSSHIADLTIFNGVLMPRASSGGGASDTDCRVCVVQYGDNNFIEGPSLLDGSIANIVQNTVDGVTIQVDTVLDIEADVDGFIHQQIQTNRMESAILNIGY